MKRIFSMLASIVIMTIVCSAQKGRVPKAVTDAFATKFPGATNVKWGKENAKEYEAEFQLNSKNISANFGMDGSWMETETEIPVSELPSAVHKAITSKYPAATITGADKIEQPGGKILYEADIKTGGKTKEVELHPDGSFVK